MAKAIPIEKCKDCPHKFADNHYSTDGWDRMETWKCKLAKDRKIQGGVEWHEENKIPIPAWCPLPDIK